MTSTIVINIAGSQIEKSIELPDPETFEKRVDERRDAINDEKLIMAREYSKFVSGPYFIYVVHQSKMNASLL